MRLRVLCAMLMSRAVLLAVLLRDAVRYAIAFWPGARNFFLNFGFRSQNILMLRDLSGVLVHPSCQLLVIVDWGKTGKERAERPGKVGPDENGSRSPPHAIKTKDD